MAIQRMPIGQFVAELEAAYKRKDGYIMGATGQDPKKWAVNSWWYNQYRDGDYTESQYQKALYWRDHAARVWDCNGMAEGIYKDFSGVNINTKARYNYANWCSEKGSGLIPVDKRVPGMAIFWGKSASSIHHVAYLYKPVDESDPAGDWYIIEARGVMYGVVRTKLFSRRPNFWGKMDLYFDYDGTEYVPIIYKLGDRTLKKGMTGDDVKELQTALIGLGYSCGNYGADGDFGSATASAVQAFQKANKLTINGEYGPETHKALVAALNTDTTTSTNMVTITGGSVNIRKGPSTSYDILKVAHKGDKFERVDATGWACIKYNDAVCWASEKYISNGTSTANSLNIRKGPGTNYISVGLVNKGYIFDLIDTNGWVPILINSIVYWVSGKYAA